MKKWILKNKLFIFIGGIAVILAGLAFNSLQNGKVPNEVIEHAESISAEAAEKESSQEYNQGQIKEEVARIHNYLNTKLCWGRYNAFKKGSSKWDEIQPTVDRFVLNLSSMIEAVEGSEKLRADLIVGSKAFTYAIENEDKTTLVYLHRIFHDLDAELNDTPLDTFGYSSYANGDLSKIWEHISSDGQ